MNNFRVGLSKNDLNSDRQYLANFFLTESSQSSVLIISIISVVIGVLVFIIILTSTHYYVKKRTQTVAINPLQSIAWEGNDLYESKQSLAKSEVPFDLPDWLKDKKEMIFLKNSITKGKLLGKGQFGNVYKGKLYQGNAV